MYNSLSIELLMQDLPIFAMFFTISQSWEVLAFFDSYFWPFNKTHEKIIAIFVIIAIIASI